MSEYDLFPTVEPEIVIMPIGHHRTLTKFQAPEREFVEPSPAASFIHWLFRYRCVKCKRPGTEINEIVPRSRSKKAVKDWRNRVLLCTDCHREYHQNGVTDDKIKNMQETRILFLKSFGREEYVRGE